MGIAILAVNQVLDSGFAIVLDVLHAANQLTRPTNRQRVSVISSRRGSVQSARGIRIPVDHGLVAPFPSVVIVPGIDFISDVDRCDSEQVESLLKRADVRPVSAYLKKAHAVGTTIAAGCTATLLLAESGLLDGKEATTTWWLSSTFRERYPHVKLRDDLTLIRQGRLLCAGAAMAHINLALAIVGKQFGPNMQDQVSRRLIINEAKRQSPFIDYSCVVNLPKPIRKADAWVRKHLPEPMTVEDVARAAATSPRTLTRHFQQSIGRSPIQFIQHLRVQEAIRLLRSTDESFESIAEKVGYKNTAGLRRIILRETGCLPSQFRRTGE